MTPKQKKLHLDTLMVMAQSVGFQQDRWSNWKRMFKEDTYRIKVKPINIRIEVKHRIGGQNWYKIVSKPIVKITLKEMALFIKRFASMEELK